ncbi:hypothetical protein BDP27DRAFT_1431311 [Rhodocollybia butyracea]|uniref:Uncharacterized protein n=1 Tax=Rhodocollybia butyracea TaxID=206335 RepID=A0A9P5P8Y1_9AGAR|nr:hypothetical protein BDP27DRAFT_1431311 [Rhodocollybia butyracea]
MSEIEHRNLCFRTQGVDVAKIIEHSRAYADIQNEIKCSICRLQKPPPSCLRPENSLVCELCHGRKRTCDFTTLLRFCAYAQLERITVAAAVAHLNSLVDLKFPEALFRDALKVLERGNNSVSALQAIAEERKGLNTFLHLQKEESTSTAKLDPSIHPVAESSTRRPECPPHIPPHSSPEISQKRAAPSAPEQADCVVRPRLHKSNPSPLESVPTVPPFIPTHPVPSNSNPPASRPAPVPTVEGSGVDERDLPSKFIQTYRSTVRQLQDEKERSARYRQERDRLQDELRSAAARIQGLQADAHVEHNRAEELFARVKTAEASSVLVTEEFRKSRQRTVELESQLAARPMRSESEVDVSRLQESIRRLQGTVDRMRDKLNEAARSFNVLSTQHERLLRRNDRIAETNRRVAREISELEATLVEKKREVRMLGNMVLFSVGPSAESLVRDLQDDREALAKERNLALEYATMLRQLDLPGFVRRFEQRVSEPLFRLTNLLRICEDREIVKSPLFVEAYSTLSEATPAITSAACRAQLALCTVLEDFDLQFPQVHELLRQSSGSWVVPDLLRNAGIEPAISTIEPIFDFDRTVPYSEYLKSSVDFFPLQTLRDPESPALQVAIKKLLAEFKVIPGLPEQEDEMEDEMEGELEGAFQMDVTVTVTPDVEAGDRRLWVKSFPKEMSP